MSENIPEKSLTNRLMGRLDGPSISRTALRLVIASLIVGALLSVFGIKPVELWLRIWNGVKYGAEQVYGHGIEGVTLVLTLIVTGAVIVIPIWIIRFLLSGRK